MLLKYALSFAYCLRLLLCSSSRIDSGGEAAVRIVWLTEMSALASWSQCPSKRKSLHLYKSSRSSEQKSVWITKTESWPLNQFLDLFQSTDPRAQKPLNEGEAGSPCEKTLLDCPQLALLVFLPVFPQRANGCLPEWLWSRDKEIDFPRITGYWFWSDTNSWRPKVSSQSRGLGWSGDQWSFNSDPTHRVPSGCANPSRGYAPVLEWVIGIDISAAGRTPTMVPWPREQGLFYGVKGQIETARTTSTYKISKPKTIPYSQRDCSRYCHRQGLERCWSGDSHHLLVRLAYLACAENRWILENDTGLLVQFWQHF